mmetsp:Transcript_50308/g.57879  ORF Transcript_50308/g.57879 Transcript_50308/m.57879 type:complete len:96 (+) Transcript_50308:444-731(+)
MIDLEDRTVETEGDPIVEIEEGGQAAEIEGAEMIIDVIDADLEAETEAEKEEIEIEDVAKNREDLAQTADLVLEIERNEVVLHQIEREINNSSQE